MRIIDLRSDTLAMPTEEMLDSIKRAKLGDDVFRDDPTVIKLEEMAADKMGKEAALLVTSGTQGNTVSILAQCEQSRSERGYEIILEEQSHIWQHEIGGLVVSAHGLITKTIKGYLGWMKPRDIKKTIQEDNRNYSRVKLLCLEVSSL